MSDLLNEGTSTYGSGGIDTYTPAVNNTDVIEAKHPNGLAEGITQMQGKLGQGTVLAGSLSNLAARLAVGHNPDGTHKTLPEDEGGTGQSVYAVGDMLYADATDSLALLNIGSIFKVLGINAAGTAPTYISGLKTHGASSFGSGSTYSHSGNDATWQGSQTQKLYFFNDVTIIGAETVTLGQNCVVVYASGTIDISGTLTNAGNGAPGGSGQVAAGDNGTSGGAGGGAGGGGGGQQTGGNGGNCVDFLDESTLGSGGSGGATTTVGSAGMAVTGANALLNVLELLRDRGGASGGGGGGDNSGAAGGNGGNGGGTIVLIAPRIIGNGTINTSAGNGGNGDGGGGNTGGGGGGSAGNFFAFTNSWEFTGTITQTAGSGGTGNGSGGNGGAGSAGVKQIFVFG